MVFAVKPCRKKHKIYFYVTNVFFDAGDLGECMETFLGPCRLKKPPKIALHFSESITIGISIQTGRLLPRVILASCWPCHRAVRKMTSRKSYWVSGAELPDLLRRPHLPAFCVDFNRFENSAAAVASLATSKVLVWICPESLDSVTCLGEPNHMRRYLFKFGCRRPQKSSLFYHFWSVFWDPFVPRENSFLQYFTKISQKFSETRLPA